VLVQPALPAVVGAGEVGVAAGGLGDQRVVGELAPVVVGDGVEDAFEPLGDAAQGIGRLGLGLARDAPREQSLGLALGQRHEAAAVPLADHRVALPVADGGARLDRLRALGDVRPARDPAPEVVLPVALPPLPRRVPEAGVQVAARALVAPHQPVDGLARHPVATIQAHSARYLLGTPVEPQLPDHLRPHGLRQPNASATIGMPIVAEALRLLRPAPPLPRVPPQLPRHRRRRPPYRPRDLRARIPRLQALPDVVSLLRGQVGVAFRHGVPPAVW